MFGYSIALGGLIYYKIGGEQAQAAYTKLTGDENSTFNRFRRSLWAKVGAVFLALFVVFAMAHGFSSDKGIDIASTHTGLTGVPEPEMVDAYNSAMEELGEVSAGLGSFDGINTHPTHYSNEETYPSHYASEDDHPTHYTTDVMDNIPTSRLLDIVIYISPTSDNDSLTIFEEILLQPTMSTLGPRIITYGEVRANFPVHQHVPLTGIGSASAAYADYISNHYNSLSEHTIFLHTDVDARHLPTTISSRYNARTGVVELSRGGYSVCRCVECVDSLSNTHFTKTDELYALTNENVCSSTQQLLV
jgi:Protein of unknown function (DUF3431)